MPTQSTRPRRSPRRAADTRQVVPFAHLKKTTHLVHDVFGAGGHFFIVFHEADIFEVAIQRLLSHGHFGQGLCGLLEDLKLGVDNAELLADLIYAHSD